MLQVFLKKKTLQYFILRLLDFLNKSWWLFLSLNSRFYILIGIYENNNFDVYYKLSFGIIPGSIQHDKIKKILLKIWKKIIKIIKIVPLL